MQAQLSTLVAKATAELPALKTRPEFEAAKARYVGPNGELTALMKQMGAVPKEQRPAVGKLVNEAKTQLQAQLDRALARIADSELAAQLGSPVDPTLPAPDPGPGTYHPLTLVREEMCRILRKVGFTVADGPEVETEFYCFDALNTPPTIRRVTRRTRFISRSRRVSPTFRSRIPTRNTSSARTRRRSRSARCSRAPRRSASCRRAAYIVATPPTPRTARTSTSSNACMSTGTSRSAT